jgi:hypothetical protein
MRKLEVCDDSSRLLSDNLGSDVNEPARHQESEQLTAAVRVKPTAPLTIKLLVLYGKRKFVFVYTTADESSRS